MLDRVTVAYRGVKYEIGRGRDYFGIWTVAGPRSQPLEWWPETPEGWSAAWTRFAALEAPGAITPVGRTTARSAERAPAIGARARGTVPALLLGAGVVLGIAGLFPAYLNGTSLAAQPGNLAAHVIYLAAWTASAALIVLGGTRQRVGALLATGLSAVTFGLFLADAGEAIAGGAHAAGAGLVLSLVGWAACAAGSAVAFLARPAGAASRGPAASPAAAAEAAGADRRLVTLARPRGAAVGPAVLLVLAGLGVAAFFAPAWDSFTLRTAAGQTQTLTAGNAFAEPGVVIAGNVAVMVALAAVVILGALWRPVRHGAVLLAGAIIPMAALAVSALIQVGQAPSPTQFGLTPAQASQLGLTISAGLTPYFWIYCVFVVALVVSCAWLLFSPREAPVLPSGHPAGAGDGADPDTQLPTWHVARADAYDTAGVRSPQTDDDEWDIGTEPNGDEFDSYEEFESENPSDGTVTPASCARQADRGDEAGPGAGRG